MRSRYAKIKINGRTFLLHRYLMEQHLGRKLSRSELVHHKNHDRYDNRIDNLEIKTPQAHAQHHNQRYPLTKRCQACGKEFEPHPTKRKRAKTCSKTCADNMRAFTKCSPSGEFSGLNPKSPPSRRGRRQLFVETKINQTKEIKP